MKYAAENLVEDNTAYENVEISVEQVATTFEQVVSYVVAKDIQNAIYFLDIELSQNSEAKNGVDLAEFIKNKIRMLRLFLLLLMINMPLNLSKTNWCN